MCEILGKATARAAKQFIEKIDEIKAYIEQVREVESLTGLNFGLTEWSAFFRSHITIDKKDVPAIRKAIGRFDRKNISKYVPYDFDETNEILVSFSALSPKFNQLRFSYRSQFRSGGKCRVENIVSTDKQLVCEA